MATTTTILFLCITAVVINVCVVDSAHHHTAAPAPAADCSTVILSMADCLSYVTAGSTVQKPEGTCCSGLKTVLKTDAQCLCEAFKNSAQLGLQLNTTKALALPAACKIKAPSATNCGMSLGTATAPVQSPMASGMAPTMAAFGPSIAVAPTPASQGSGSSGLAMSTISVFLSLLLSVYFCSY
ncbi:non-specific lipid transfer protein GPI-anchored 31-like isoform X1 [Rutidosis leptorrhynchoides]|uniref:non-specific lipid transfer protein GPI-anchored 31-like isoform X1 n=1 Tax=Rutidosis leptorrhynchoides TaxID=125765 RepID=UPI003A99F470